MKHQQQQQPHSNVKYHTPKKITLPHKNGNGNGYSLSLLYNSHIHIIQTLPIPFSSKLFLTLTAKVKMSRRNQTFYRCKFMKSQKPRTQKIKFRQKNWKLRLRNLTDSNKIIFKIQNFILTCIISFYLIFSLYLFRFRFRFTLNNILYRMQKAKAKTIFSKIRIRIRKQLLSKSNGKWIISFRVQCFQFRLYSSSLSEDV